MARRFTDLSTRDFEKIPILTLDHTNVGIERIYIHLYNSRNMNWYLAEYGPIGKRFFGYYENPGDGMASGFCTIDDIMKYVKKGGKWEPLVDEDWTPTEAREIEKLKAYIQQVKLCPDW